jgi:hypothetical protein
MYLYLRSIGSALLLSSALGPPGMDGDAGCGAVDRMRYCITFTPADVVGVTVS